MHRFGARSYVTVALRNDGRLLGGIAVYRQEVRVRQSVCKILSEIRTLRQIDVNFSQWLTVNRSALAEIGPEIELMVSKL